VEAEPIEEDQQHIDSKKGSEDIGIDSEKEKILG
jgi:hypothetical protein